MRQDIDELIQAVNTLYAYVNEYWEQRHSMDPEWAWSEPIHPETHRIDWWSYPQRICVTWNDGEDYDEFPKEHLRAPDWEKAIKDYMAERAHQRLEYTKRMRALEAAREAAQNKRTEEEERQLLEELISKYGIPR